MYRKIHISLAVLILIPIGEMLDNAEGAVVIDSKEYECAKLVAKLVELLSEKNESSEANRLLRTTLSRKLARDCGLHVVRPGETVTSIAIRYDTSIDELRRLNPGIVGARPPLVLFQVLRIREILGNNLGQSKEANSVD